MSNTRIHIYISDDHDDDDDDDGDDGYTASNHLI